MPHCPRGKYGLLQHDGTNHLGSKAEPPPPDSWAADRSATTFRDSNSGLKLKMPAQVFCIAGVLTLRSGGHNTLFLAVSHDLTRHKAPMHTPKPPFPPDPVRSIRSHHVHALHIHRASQHILTHRPALCPPQREYGWSVAPFSPSWIVHRAAPRARPPPRHRPRCHFFMIERGCPGQQQEHTGIRAHG